MSDTFQVSNGTPANFNDGTVKLTVNGVAKGSVPVQSGETLGAFLSRQAKNAGIKTFSAFANGSKLDTADSSKSAVSYTSLEIVAKDSRG